MLMLTHHQLRGGQFTKTTRLQKVHYPHATRCGGDIVTLL